MNENKKLNEILKVVALSEGVDIEGNCSVTSGNLDQIKTKLITEYNIDPLMADYITRIDNYENRLTEIKERCYYHKSKIRYLLLQDLKYYKRHGKLIDLVDVNYNPKFLALINVWDAKGFKGNLAELSDHKYSFAFAMYRCKKDNLPTKWICFLAPFCGFDHMSYIDRWFLFFKKASRIYSEQDLNEIQNYLCTNNKQFFNFEKLLELKYDLMMFIKMDFDKGLLTGRIIRSIKRTNISMSNLIFFSQFKNNYKVIALFESTIESMLSDKVNLSKLYNDAEIAPLEFLGIRALACSQGKTFNEEEKLLENFKLYYLKGNEIEDYFSYSTTPTYK